MIDAFLPRDLKRGMAGNKHAVSACCLGDCICNCACFFFAIVIGLPLGVMLVAGEKGGVLPLPAWLMHILNVVINLLRSVPFLILMVLVFPLTRLIVGKVASELPRRSCRLQ